MDLPWRGAILKNHDVMMMTPFLIELGVGKTKTKDPTPLERPRPRPTPPHQKLKMLGFQRKSVHGELLMDARKTVPTVAVC